MAAVNCPFSRITKMILFCVISISIDGRLCAQAQSSSQQPATTLASVKSTEAEQLGKTRPVNLIIINDATNEVANKSVTNALKTIKDKDPDLIGKVLTVKVNAGDRTTDMDEICKVWDAAIAQDSTEVPDILLDTTRVGRAAETVSAFTAAVGIPTLSAQFSRVEGQKNWRYPDADQNKYLVHFVQPTDLMPEVFRELVFQMDITSVGVIFDESFVMEHKYGSLFINSPPRLIIMPSKQSPDEIRRILVQFRERHIHNYFVLGGEETVRTVMNIGQSLNLTGPVYGWYALTEQDFEPSCDCRNVSIMIFKPLISSAGKQRFADLPLSAEFPLTSSFYYDLLQLGTKAMSLSIARGKWPTNATYFGCDAFDGENTPIRKFDYLKDLIDVSAEFQWTLAGIAWGRVDDQHRAKFDMTAKMVRIVAGNPISSKDVAVWPAGLESHIQVEDDAVVRNHTGVPNYRASAMVKVPFVMYDPKTKVWSGYCIDVLNAIAAESNFTYVIHEAYDKKFGSRHENGTWNGMIRELQDNEADIALGSLSVTAERDSVVDFTVPYYDLVGFSILMKKPSSATSLFKFFNVFDDAVWFCIIGCYFFATMLLWIFNRWSPYAYRKNREQPLVGDEKRRVFDLRECLWFSMTSLTPQGGGEAPMNWSGCVVAGTWWLFGFIITASYTANLAAFLIITRLESSVRSLDELANQYKIQYAPINGSEAHVYFEKMGRVESMFDGIWQDMILNESIKYPERAELALWDYPVDDKYRKILKAMKTSGLPVDMNEALNRIRHVSSPNADEFALIGDAADIKYLELTNCDLLRVGSEFGRKPYAMAVRQRAVLKDILNAGLLRLTENGILEILKMQWWELNPNKKICDEMTEQSDGISIANIGGVFVVVLVGIVASCSILAFEYYWYSCRPKHKKQLIRNIDSGTAAQNPSAIRFTVKPAKTPGEPDSNPLHHDCN